MKKIICVTIMLLQLITISAQRRIMIYDPELNQPVRDFTVWTNTSHTDSTNLLGEVALPERFDTLLLTKPGYITLRIPAKLVEDTIPVIKDYNNIGEVVVYASRQNDFQEAVKRWTKEDRTEMQLKHPITGIDFNLSDLISKKRRNEKKNSKRMAKLFQKMDEEDNDPIIHSYRRAFNIRPKD